MRRLPRILAAIGLGAASFGSGRPSLHAQASAARVEKLQFVAVLSRHGVRAPLDTPEALQDYAPQPWPKWDAPAAYLTPRGNKLMQILGVYYRQYLAGAGLLGATGCTDLDRFYFWSDTVGRDIESAWALGRAMMPDCNITVHRLAEGRPDPLFSTRVAGVGKYDVVKAKAAFLKVVGASPEAVVENYRGDVERIEEILLGCKPSPACPPAGKEIRKRILKQPALLLPDNAPPSSPAISAAHAVTEAFVLEYLNGMDEKDIAWGRLDAARLREVLKFEGRYWDTAVTSYAARSGASNLLSHILRSLAQAVGAAPVPGALGNPGDKALFVLGHDSNIKNIALLLGLSWELEKGGQANEVPPGAALIFELWQDGASGKRTVRIYLQSQTFEQIRRMTPLGLQTPPVRIALPLPGCAGTGETFCEWNRFQTAVESGIDPAFVEPVATGGRGL